MYFATKNKFIMLVGLPGSGKSFLASQFAENLSKVDPSTPVIWISSDQIRLELYGSEEVQGDTGEVFGEMLLRTKRALQEEKTVIYDACNVSSKKRMALLRELKKYLCTKICFICATPYQDCIRRNQNRSRVVPEHVIKRMYLNWNTPYFFEGWDEIYIEYSEKSKGTYGTIEDYVQRQMDFPQDNPHHRETLGEHLQMTREYIIKNFNCVEESNLATAAWIHDCGKPFVKEFRDLKGNKTKIAHYYQHQCNGAYDVLFFEIDNKDMRDMLEISILINLHMHPFGWREMKHCEKQQKLWGEKLYQDIAALHEADKASSCSALESC